MRSACLPRPRLGNRWLVGLLLLAPLALATEPAAAKKVRPVCEGGAFFAEGLPPLALGEDRALADFVEVDVEAGTVRIAGCEAVPARIKGKRNQKVKAEFPVGACRGLDAIGKLKLRFKKDCEVAKGKVKFKTRPRQKRKLEARRADAVEAELEEESAVSETIGPAGGSLETTDSTGRRYQLDIHEGAIPEERLVTLTPVVAMSGLALDGLLAAADFTPAGLRLVPPATLTVELPEPGEAEGRVGFGYEDQGTAPELYPVQLEAGTWSVPVWHFSGAGVGTGPSPAGQFFLDQVQAAAGDPQLLAAACATWFDANLESALTNADSDSLLTPAVNDLLAWNGLCVGKDRYELATSLLRTALEAAVDRAHIRCAALQSLEAANDALIWQAVAFNFLIDTGALSLEEVEAGLCVEVSYVDTSYPANPPIGVNQTLSVTVGLSFNGSSTVFTETLEVVVEATGASGDDPLGLTDSSGLWTGSFAVDGSGDAVFRINSCIQASAYPRLSTICQTALVVRGLEVEPSSVILAVGATQQFEAKRFGVTYSSVTWSATSGEIGNGLYIAPDGVGSHTITATDLMNPGSTATATVTVIPGDDDDDDDDDAADCVEVGDGQLTHSHYVLLQLGDQSGFSDSAGSSSVSHSLSAGGCTTSGTTSGFGDMEATIAAGGGCGDDTVRATTFSLDHVRITPADSSRRVAIVRGRFAIELTGSSSPTQSFNVIEASVNSGLGGWLQPGFVSLPSFGAGDSIDEVATLDVELHNQANRLTFPMSWSVHVQAQVLPSGHSANVTARARWLGITEILDQDDALILNYEICSNSGTDYRNAVP